MKAPSWLPAAALVGWFAALCFAERRWPLRTATRPPGRRLRRNLVIAALAGITVQRAEKPVVDRIADWVERRRFGLLRLIPLPRWLERTLALLLLDYTLWVYHVLAHRLEVLWRFHEVHHVDLDLDSSTALRFHFGELLQSVPWRAAQVALLGIRPCDLVLWQRLTLAEVMFHHANVRLPPRLEGILARVLVTPRVHGIHHSTVRGETESNWSSGLTWWDRLHGTWLADVPQAEILIGVPAHRDPHRLRLRDLLVLPFGSRAHDSWRTRTGRRFARAPSGELLLIDRTPVAGAGQRLR